ncbi:hypothetical protein CA13_03570 [Planctomycetes bacterium CA13]|uniref:Uncharacterized protein n=1 Tax=Novipirellula herctigrandis TaxID=2527986 RepID=A0A5C5YVU4_9BACT|nr:hypothetical protein CA13_03570 [Planctomycetes bacterium CA13]
MNRFVSLLLLPMFMLGQTLPHSHAGSNVREPDDHSLRPHVHITHSHHDHHGGHEHGHQHDAEEFSVGGFGDLSPFANHDDDAVYFATSAVSTNRVLVASQSDWLRMLALSPPSALSPSIVTVSDLCCCSRISDPPDRYSALPVYLLTASLRL